MPQYQHIDAAMRIHSIILSALKQRDPRIPQNRAALYERGRLKGRELKDLPWFTGGAMGAVIESITGEGKTLFGDRLCAALFECQVVEHDAADDCGWSAVKQLNYLRVFMPAGAGRAGFILEAAKEMDRLLGTDYSAELKARSMSVEKQLVHLLIWLSVHRCGVLIIEEAQERIIGSVDFGTEFLIFFLKVMNWGIPLVLIGNPNALDIVRTFSQDRRRFSDGVWCRLEPISFWQSSEWQEDLIPTIWGWTVLPEPDEPIARLPEYLWLRTGGSRSSLARLRRESLLLAVASDALSVTRQHVEDAYRSQSFAEMHPLINAFVNKDPSLLEPFTDIPRKHFAAKWTLERKVAQARKDKADKDRADKERANKEQNLSSEPPREERSGPAAEDSGPSEARASQFSDGGPPTAPVGDRASEDDQPIKPRARRTASKATVRKLETALSESVGSPPPHAAPALGKQSDVQVADATTQASTSAPPRSAFRHMFRKPRTLDGQ